MSTTATHEPEQRDGSRAAATRERRAPSAVRGHRCNCGGTCPQCKASSLLQLQPVAGSDTSALETQADAAASSASSGEQVGPLSPATATSSSSGRIVEDADTPGMGQLRKSEFLDELRGAVCAVAEEELAGTGRTTEGCPELDYWFSYYALRDPTQIERAIRRYAPETESAASAHDYISPLVERLRTAVRIWVATGGISGVPEVLSLARLGADAVPGGAAEAFSEDDRLLVQSSGGNSAPGVDPESVRAELGRGQALDARTRARMEGSFGVSFRDVRIHDDADTASLATRLGARAFAVGDDIGFGSGEYRPGTLAGRALLAHELAHTVQQRGGKSGAAAGLETEANSAAGAALLGRRAQLGTRGGLALQRCNRSGTSSKDAGPGGATTGTADRDAGADDAGPGDAGATPARPPLPAEPTAKCTAATAPGDAIVDHRVDPPAATISNPGDKVTITVTFACKPRKDGFSEIVGPLGESIGRKTVPGGSGRFTREWDGKKFFTDVGTYIADDGVYRHRLSKLVYAFGKGSKKGPSPDLVATGPLLESPPITVRVKGAVTAAPTGAAAPATSHYTPANVTALAEIIRSEMGIGNANEQTAIAWAVRNQMIRLNTRDVTEARGHFGDAQGQAATADETAIADSVLRAPMANDTTQGAIKWFSPRSMPSAPKAGVDTSGGPIKVIDGGTSHQVLAPGFHLSMQNFQPTGVREWFLRLYRL